MSRLPRRLLFILLLLACVQGYAGPNQAPVVSLTSPLSGENFAPQTDIVLAASASDPDGSIAQVDFYWGGSHLIGTSTAYPYSVTWNGVLAGSYSLTAKATDNQGKSTTSAAVSITVSTPTTTISSPAPNSAIPGGLVTVTGTFSGTADTTILVDNGNTSRLATINGSYYSATVPVVPGSNTLTVSVARRDLTSERVSIDVMADPAPVLTFTSPNTTTFDAPANLMLGVDAISPAGSISKVDFFENGAFLGTSIAPPYEYAWNVVSGGNYNVSATATDNLGQTSTAWLYLTINAPNTPPTVSLTSPSDGMTFTAPASISLAASASDPDGSIASVEFDEGTNVIAVTNVTPYQATWSDVPAGTYTLTAKATDDRNATTTSSPVSITVTPPNNPPTVTLTSPLDNASFTAPASIQLGASATDSDGSIAKVEFYEGSNLIGTVTAAPYDFTWTNVAAGSYSLTAKATDDLGATTISSAVNINVNVNSPPTANLTSPQNNATFLEPATVQLSADAADSDGSVTKVEFYEGSNLIGTVTAAPYDFTWSNVTAGSYNLTAVATDNLGASGTSTPVSITVNAPQATILSPMDGSTLTGDKILVSGTFQGPTNTGIVVNGTIAATTSDNHFYAEIPLTAGSNTITVNLTTPIGQTGTSSITVSADGVAPLVQVIADNLEVITPEDVNFTITNTDSTDATVQINGGTPFTVPAGSSVIQNYSLTTPGAYPLTFTASANASSIDFVLVAQDPVVIDNILQGVYSGMLDKLRAGDINAAMYAINANGYDKYLAVFNTLAPNLSTIVDQLGTLQTGTFSTHSAEYPLVRDTANGQEGFSVDFLRGEDGVWRIDSM